MNWDEFARQLLRGVPVSTERPTPSTRLKDLAPDKVGKAAVSQQLRRLLRGTAPELLDSIETVGEAFEWYQTAAERSDDADQPQARVRLRPFEERDFAALYRAATSPEGGFRWRYRGGTPSPDIFRAQLFDAVLAQYIVEGVEDGAAYGLVCAYNARLDNQTAYIAFLRSSERRGRGEMMEAMMLFIDHLFHGWNLRKLYAEVPEFNAKAMFDTDSRSLEVEGRLTDHEYHDGKWWDLLTIALRREAWMGEAPLWLQDHPADE